MEGSYEPQSNLLSLIAIVVLGLIGFLGYQRLSVSAQNTTPSTPTAKVKEDMVSADQDRLTGGAPVIRGMTAQVELKTK